MGNSQSRLKVLVVDDEEYIRKALKVLLEKADFEVHEAANGKIAQTLIGLETFSVVVSDINMPGSGISGIELLEFIKQNHSELPVVLMSGFSQLFETKRAFELGVNAFLAKPFKSDELLFAIRETCGVKTRPPPLPEKDISQDYCKVAVDHFISGRELKFEIFVRLSAKKYTKIAHQGEDLTLERIRAFKGKGVDYLYIKKEDFAKYVGLNLAVSRALKNGFQIAPEKKAGLLKHANEVVLANLFLNGTDEANFASAKETLEITISLLSESPDTFNLLTTLSQSGDYLYTHSLGVSLYGVMIAKQMGWNSMVTLFRVSTAGIFHDIGMKEFDRALLEKPRSEFSHAEVKIFETHPARGAEILATVASIPGEILQVVLHHHESCNGRGYPSNLSRNAITPHAKLLAVADEFCKLALPGPGTTALAPQQAMERLSLLHGNALDPEFVAALKRVLKLDDLAPLKRVGK